MDTVIDCGKYNGKHGSYGPSGTARQLVIMVNNFEFGSWAWIISEKSDGIRQGLNL